jgi:glucan phosphorylase
MEICLESGIPTYSGGLGILASDTVRSAADLKIPMVAITLLHRKGYFFQRIDDSGKQTKEIFDEIIFGSFYVVIRCRSGICLRTAKV